MNKGIYIIMAFMAAMLTGIFSCNNTKSYTDMLKEQKRAISKLFADSGLVLLRSYPANGVFAPNEFYIMDNGVYLNVVDSGNGNRAVPGLTSIVCRFHANILMDTVPYENMSNGSFPLIYTYGQTGYTSQEASMQYFFCTAMFSPLAYVGDSSEVKIIIPFEISSSYYQNKGNPVYYHKMRYRFELR
ncbi:MAG: DUF4827 domain-containing protein [Tannerellaceae bacterium]|jgi:hypothetical protein|nr:DUF4827 domain-containing protein [Tannerellaceae bacterium]